MENIILERIQEIIQKNNLEKNYFDYKRELPKEKYKFIHDILCLSNVVLDGNTTRYLIYGVEEYDEKPKIVGITDEQQDNFLFKENKFHNFIEKISFQRKPELNWYEITIEEKHLIIIEIKDISNKPFYLLKKYSENKNCCPNGVVFTRNGSTNTPIDKNASDHQMEEMFLERFGVLKPIDIRINLLLSKPGKWIKTFDELERTFYYHENHPEFTFTITNETYDKNYWEKWCNYRNIAKDAMIVKSFLKYHSTILGVYFVVYRDGGRLINIRPEMSVINGKEVFYYIEQSKEFYLNEIITSDYCKNLMENNIPQTIQVLDKKPH